jgi:tripartite-type tricarboxylate transporter receptor subunit TctC
MPVLSRLCTLAFVVLALALAPTAAAAADDYPSRPVRIIVPYSPGGPTDIYGRIIAQGLSEALRQPFVLENRPGAGTIIGTDLAAKAAPDGHTLLMISSTHATQETLTPDKPYQLLRDFVAVAPLISNELVMVVHPSLPAHSVQEFIALAKAKPGTLNYASSGIGSNYHMAAELLKSMTGIDIVHVPYKGSGGARNDILGGQVQMMFDAVPTMAPMVLGGNVRALATTGKTRPALLPEIPTMEEAGVPGYEAIQWIGFMAPARTPKPIVDRLNAEINKFLARPDIRKTWESQGATPMAMTPAEFEDYVRAQIAKWGKVVQEAGLIEK